MGVGLTMAVIASPLYTPILSEAVKKFSYHLGIAFQIHDDILDVESSSEALGKPQFSDQNGNKQTLLAHIGIAKCKALRELFKA